MQDTVNPNAAKVDELLGWLIETVKGSTEFVKEQAPAVAQDIVRYGVISNIVWIVICLFALIVAWVVFLWVGMAVDRREAVRAKEHRATHPHDSIAPDWAEGSIAIFGGSFGFACLVTLICVPAAFSAINPLLKTSHAPRLYVLEECTKMIRNK